MIQNHHKENFDALVRAIRAGDCVIMECKEKGTGKPVIALCATWFDGDAFEFVPYARLFENGYAEVDPPEPGAPAAPMVQG